MANWSSEGEADEDEEAEGVALLRGRFWEDDDVTTTLGITWGGPASRGPGMVEESVRESSERKKSERSSWSPSSLDSERKDMKSGLSVVVGEGAGNTDETNSSPRSTSEGGEERNGYYGFIPCQKEREKEGEKETTQQEEEEGEEGRWKKKEGRGKKKKQINKPEVSSLNKPTL